MINLQSARRSLQRSFARSTTFKVGAGILIGALATGGVASALTPSSSSLQACVDNRTKAMYLASDGNCLKSRTLVDLGSGNMTVKSIAAAVTPSVVSVDVSSTTGSGTGSGSIIRSSATSSYILTNNHVVALAAPSGSISVEFYNGETIDATIVGTDVTYDLAVIEVKKGNLPVISFGDSSKLSIGDPVVAIGSPLGLASTVTSGIISALNRPVITGTTGSESYIDAIQTDAAINPGNSGGALLDGQGRIIGVNSAIATLTAGGESGSIGLGFSIPINQAKRIATDIIDTPTHKSSRPILGVFFNTSYTGVGAKISKLSPGEAADLAGNPVGAVVRSIDGFKISDPTSATVRIRSYAPRAKVSIVVDLPSGESKTFTVTLGSAPSP